MKTLKLENVGDQSKAPWRRHCRVSTFYRYRGNDNCQLLRWSLFSLNPALFLSLSLSLPLVICLKQLNMRIWTDAKNKGSNARILRNFFSRRNGIYPPKTSYHLLALVFLFSLKRLLLTANQAYRVLDISSLRFNTKAPKRTLHLRTLSWAGQDGKTMTWSIIGFSNFPPDRKVSQIPHLFRPIPQAIPPASTKSQGTYCPGRGGSWYLRCIQMAFCPSWNVWKLVFLFQMVFWDVTV